MHYQHDPIQTTKTSVHGAINMLGLAKRLKCRILQASTSEVYGDPAVHPQKEDYWGNVNPIGPRSCYDEGKRCAETLFFDYHRQVGLEIKVARIFNTYGPRMQPDDGRVVSNFIVQALRGDPITIYGDGGQTRSFCYVDDLVDGLIRLMNSPKDVTGPVNIGNPGEFSIRELAELVIAQTGAVRSSSACRLPTDDPRQRKPDITLAKSVLGWSPQVPLAKGLEPTIAYFRGVVAADRKPSLRCHEQSRRTENGRRTGGWGAGRLVRIIFINRFFYPDHSGTSQMLSDLAFALAGRGLTLDIITSRLRYDGPDEVLRAQRNDQRRQRPPGLDVAVRPAKSHRPRGRLSDVLSDGGLDAVAPGPARRHRRGQDRSADAVGAGVADRAAARRQARQLAAGCLSRDRRTVRKRYARQPDRFPR